MLKHLKQCNGCTTTEDEKHHCVFRLLDMIFLCPCIDCLVKPMCKSGCDERSEKAFKIMEVSHGMDRETWNAIRRL